MDPVDGTSDTEVKLPGVCKGPTVDWGCLKGLGGHYRRLRLNLLVLL